MRKNVNLLTVAIIGIAIMTSMASAAIIAPVSPIDPTFGYFAQNGTSLDNMINGSGLNDTNANGILGDAGDLHDVCATLADHQAKEAESFPGAFWGFNLGGTYDITQVIMWNGTYDDLGVLEVYFGYESPTHGLAWDATMHPNDAPGIGVGQVLNVNWMGATKVYGWYTQNLHLDPVTGLLIDTIGPTSVAEIRFVGTPTIPEPATIGLLGMGVLGLIRRRKA